MLFHDKVPEVLETDYDFLFEQSLLDLPAAKQQDVWQAREIGNRLASYGIRPEDVDAIRKSIEEQADDISRLKAEVKEKATEYKNVSRLKYNASLAVNPEYLKAHDGEEHSAEEHEMDVDEVNRDGDKDTVKKVDLRKKSGYRSADKYFDSMSR